MLGERRDQTTAGQEGGRAKAAERKKMWIKLAIESNEFHTFAENLTCPWNNRRGSIRPWQPSHTH
ncbi:MAG: hypothetical protein ACJZ6A_08875 [Candidatus Poseidoniaceae archaeon]